MSVLFLSAGVLFVGAFSLWISLMKVDFQNVLYSKRTVYVSAKTQNVCEKMMYTFVCIYLYSFGFLT